MKKLTLLAVAICAVSASQAMTWRKSYKANPAATLAQLKTGVNLDTKTDAILNIHESKLTYKQNGETNQSRHAWSFLKSAAWSTGFAWMAQQSYTAVSKSLGILADAKTPKIDREAAASTVVIVGVIGISSAYFGFYNLLSTVHHADKTVRYQSHVTNRLADINKMKEALRENPRFKQAQPAAQQAQPDFFPIN